jgi:hypothetical protein
MTVGISLIHPHTSHIHDVNLYEPHTRPASYEPHTAVHFTIRASTRAAAPQLARGPPARSSRPARALHGRRGGPCRTALVRSSPSPRTTAQATRRQGMSVRPTQLALARGRAARTGPSARAWHSHLVAARPALVAPAPGRRGTCALRARALPQRILRARTAQTISRR